MNAPLRAALFAPATLLGIATSVYAAPAGIPTDGSVADVTQRVAASVVTISTVPKPVDYQPVFMTKKELDAMMKPLGAAVQKDFGVEGSGVIVAASGRILTNAHVIHDADKIRVTLADGTQVPAKLVGEDVHADLAVIQLTGTFPTLKPIVLGDSSQLRLGDIVIAIGDGTGGTSVSAGVVSQKGSSGLATNEYQDFIQTDAAIDQRNAGGALVNLKGELVGINTEITKPDGRYSFEDTGIPRNTGLAIPTNMARPIADVIVRDGRVSRGFLGVQIETATPALQTRDKLGANEGVAVAAVQPKGPAAQSKSVVAGDVIVAMAGRPVKTGGEFRDAVAATKPGSTVDLDVVHPDGHTSKTKVQVGELPEPKTTDEMLITGNIRVEKDGKMVPLDRGEDTPWWWPRTRP